MLLMIGLVTIFGVVIAAMALTPLAAEEMEHDQRQLAAVKQPAPVSLAERRLATTGSNEPQAA